MELFERMAYYGMFNVLALYMTGPQIGGSLGFSKTSAGFMMGIYTFLLYMLPLLGGAFAERYGYKKTFVISLSVLSLAYFSLSFAKDYWLVFLVLTAVAVGGALFKPTLTGTISRSTNESNSSLGFGIYYLLVNIGSFCAPFIASYLRIMSWNYVFYASAIWVALMLLPALFVYKEPKEHLDADKSGVLKVFKDSFLVMKDLRFMLLILIFSGFWLVYFQLFFTMPIFLQNYVSTVPLLEFVANISSSLHLPFQSMLQDRLLSIEAGKILVSEAIPPEIMIGINAGTIIVLQLVVSRLTEKIKPLTAIIAGIFITALSMFLTGISVNAWIIVLAIFALAIGEMSASPRFLQYVGSSAPKDKVALFLGYGFIPTGVGSLLANIMGGYLIDKGLAFGLIWTIYGIIAVLTGVLLIIYAKYINTTK